MKPKHLKHYTGTDIIYLIKEDIALIANHYFRDQKTRTYFIAAILDVLKRCKRTHDKQFYLRMIEWIATLTTNKNPRI